MRILLAGPASTPALRQSTGLALAASTHIGAQSPIAPLAGALLDAGHDVGVLTADPDVEVPVRVDDGRLSVIYVPIRSGPGHRARTRAMDFFATEVAFLQQQIVEFAPDIVHAHWTYEYAEAATRTSIPHLVTMHDLGWDTLGVFRDPYRAFRLAMKLRTMRKVKNLSVVAPFMLGRLWQYGYFRSAAVVPNGIEVTPASHSDIVARYRPDPVIAFIGSDHRLKNVSAALTAFEIVQLARPNSELHLFGPGLDGTFTGRGPGIFAHGVTANTEVRRFLKERATVCFHPSLLETFGVAVLEAKMAAVPVVGHAHSQGVPYVVGVNAGSTLVDAADANAAANAILELHTSPEHYLQQALKAHADAVARFSREAVADAYLALYRKILEGKPLA